MGYDGQRIGKRSHVILSSIFTKQKAKHEGSGFDGRVENTMTMKTTFMKHKDIPELA
jgi:hypothetical protein